MSNAIAITVKKVLALPNGRWPMSGGRESMFWLNGPRVKGGIEWMSATPDDMRAVARIFRDGGRLPVWGGHFDIQARTRLCVDIDSFLDEAGLTALEVLPLLATMHQELDGVIDLLDGYYAPVIPVADHVGSACLTAGQLRDARRESPSGDLTLLDGVITQVAIRCSLREEPWPYGGEFEGWSWVDVNLSSLPRWIAAVREYQPRWRVGTWIEDVTGGLLSKERYAQIAGELMTTGGDHVVLWGGDEQIIPIYDACSSLLPASPTRPPVRDPLRPPTRRPFEP